MDSWVTVRRAALSAELYVFKAALEEAGIETRIDGEALEGTYGAALVGFNAAPSLQVRAADESRALALLERIAEGSSDPIDPEDDEVSRETTGSSDQDTAADAAVAVQVTIRFDPTLRQDVLELGREAREVLAKQPGFLGLDGWISEEGDTLVALLGWRRLEDFQGCKRSPYWLGVLPRWSDLQEEGGVSLETRVLRRLVS